MREKLANLSGKFLFFEVRKLLRICLPEQEKWIATFKITNSHPW
jgi:hypothetical protein